MTRKALGFVILLLCGACPPGRAAAGEERAQADLLLLARARGVFAHQCAKCHNGDQQKGGLRLDGNEHVRAGGDSGPALIPGNPEESELIRRVRLPRGDEDAMPPKGKGLSEEEIGWLKDWIAAGAAWPDAAGEGFFSSAPMEPRRPEVPESPSGHPVDGFVDAYFRERGMGWREPVDDRTFARRVYLDVIGLGPTPGEMERFLGDTASGKRERLVDELLSRDSDYAEHWLSFWNDLLRNDYTGTGYITGGRKQITEWLYGALRDNLPFDEMVRQLVSPAPGAEGFIEGIRWRGTVNSSQTTEMQAAQNISQVFLGLNLKCASCHDSFVNNWKLADAYALASVFAAAPLEMHRCDKPTGRMAVPGFLYPQLGAIDGELPVGERLRQLAGVLTDPGNGRLRRTLVNRVWARFLGRGLVEPVDEMDMAPWSQDLLDWLASDFTGQGHDLRRLIRRILTSRAYELPAVTVTDGEALAGATFRFEGPVRRRLTAEQFLDAVGRLAAPVYSEAAFRPVRDPAAGAEDGVASGSWIWFPEGDPASAAPPGVRFFRREWELPGGAGAQAAEAVVAADNGFVLYADGEEVAKGEHWEQPVRVDLTPFLGDGRVVLAVRAENGSTAPNPAGLIVRARTAGLEGGSWALVSDGSWKAAAEDFPGAAWAAPEFDDSGWAAARVLGPADMAPWGGRTDLRFGEAGGPLLRAALVQNDPLLTALGRPNRETVATGRTAQATLLEALTLTNGERFTEALRRGARRWSERFPGDPSGLAAAIYGEAFLREPTSGEREILAAHLGAAPGVEAVEDLLWAILLQPEFQLID